MFGENALTIWQPQEQYGCGIQGVLHLVALTVMPDKPAGKGCFANGRFAAGYGNPPEKEGGNPIGKRGLSSGISASLPIIPGIRGQGKNVVTVVTFFRKKFEKNRLRGGKITPLPLSSCSSSSFFKLIEARSGFDSWREENRTRIPSLAQLLQASGNRENAGSGCPALEASSSWVHGPEEMPLAVVYGCGRAGRYKAADAGQAARCRA